MESERVDLTAETHGEVLRAFSKAFQQETHNLNSRPDLVWQQLYNRLQWERGTAADMVEAEWEERIKPGRKPWLQAINPFQESKALKRTLIGHTGRVNACAFSPSGEWIVSASSDKTLKIWDTSSGRELHTLTGHTGQVNSCAFRPDSEWLLSASADKTVKTWETSSGRLLRTFPGHTKAVVACAFSPNGDWILSASDDNSLKLWHATSGKELCTLPGHPPFAISPDGKWVLSASADQTLVIWDAATGHKLHTLTGHTDRIEACAISPDGLRIASASSDKTLSVWDAKRGIELFSKRGYYIGQGLIFSPEGSLIVSTTSGKTIEIWDAFSGRRLHIFRGHSDKINRCRFSPDGQRLISASLDETLKVWDITSALNILVDSGRELYTLVGHTGGVNTFSISPDGGWIVSSSTDKTLKIWDFLAVSSAGAANRPEQQSQTDNTEKITLEAFTPEGEWTVSAIQKEAHRIKDMVSRRKLDYLTNGVDWDLCTISPNGQWIASEWDIWEVASGQKALTNTGYDKNAFSPDGERLVSVIGRWLEIWDISDAGKVGAVSGRKLKSLAGHKGDINVCIFSPDGRWIVSASRDHTLKIWDAANGCELHTLTGHTGAVIDCVFSPDGRWIASAGDHTLRIWDAASGTERYCIPLLGAIRDIDVHRWKTFAACRDEGGNNYVLDLVGMKYSPIIITSEQKGQDLVFRCPACQKSYQIIQDQLDQVMTCRDPECGYQLKINSFVISTLDKRAVASEILIAARRKLKGKISRLAWQLRLGGRLKIEDVYGAAPGEMDIYSHNSIDAFSFDDWLYFVECYSDDTPHPLWRTVGYHWKIRRQRGVLGILLNLLMVVARDGQPLLFLQHDEIQFPANFEGWQVFLDYLKEKGWL